ncbi:hyphally regulated cell wall protein 1-like [Mizuhopecten yessoensis]|nr:hyphally regulated cell wall protein 1-like [Mizuhopecten yessoensis]
MAMLSVILLLVTVCNGGVIQRSRCNSLPNLCPQWCIGTSSGCTVCDCAKHGAIGSANVISGLGAVSGGSGISMINPGGMIGFGTGYNSGNSQPSPVIGRFDSNLPGGFSPANMGPSNPFLTVSGGSDPSNPYGFGNPANLGMAAGAGKPSNPGGSTSIAGNPVLTAGNPGNLAGSSAGALQQTGQSGSGSNIGSNTGSGVPSVQHIQSAVTTHKSPTVKQSTAPVTTTPTLTTTPSTTSSVPHQKTTSASGTCAPLRCTSPCAKGIVLAPNGCPMCLCQP